MVPEELAKVNGIVKPKAAPKPNARKPGKPGN
jgi:hypothetical protein